MPHATNAHDLWNGSVPVKYATSSFCQFTVVNNTTLAVAHENLLSGRLNGDLLIYGRLDKRRNSLLYIHNLTTKVNYTRKVETKKLKGEMYNDY